jgi:hypothetical protein
MMPASMDWVDVITRFIVPPILGGAGGLIAIYANWGIEKSRQRLARRRELITGWRMELMPMLRDRSRGWHELRPEVTASPYYASLRPHLSKEALKRLENERLVVAGGDFPVQDFTNEIGRIEREWKLV